MSKYQDYTPDTSKDKPVGFSLYGMDFDCQPAIPFGIITDFADKIGAFSNTPEGVEDADEIGVEALREIVTAVDDLFRTAIIDPVQYQEWVALQRDPKRIVRMKTLLDISMNLLDQYMADEEGNERPTGRRSSKRSGKASRGAGSRGGASRGTSTYTRSEPTAV